MMQPVIRYNHTRLRIEGLPLKDGGTTHLEIEISKRGLSLPYADERWWAKTKLGRPSGFPRKRGILIAKAQLQDLVVSVWGESVYALVNSWVLNKGTQAIRDEIEDNGVKFDIGILVRGRFADGTSGVKQLKWHLRYPDEDNELSNIVDVDFDRPDVHNMYGHLQTYRITDDLCLYIIGKTDRTPQALAKWLVFGKDLYPM